MYSQNSTDDVRVFGDEIYQKCVVVYGSKLPQAEIASFMAHSQQIGPAQQDICREALVHLMTGCRFTEQNA